MDPSRRSIAALLSAAAAAVAQNAKPATLESAVYPFEALPVRGTGATRSRSVLRGKNRKGMTVEIHHTELAVGAAPHPPHHHVHEEIVAVREGVVEVTVAGKSVKLASGGIAYIASNEEHGWRNAGDTPAHYIVITLGMDEGA